MSNLTTFTQANGYIPDIFEILVDLPPSQKINAARFQTLKLQASLSEAEQIELNNLTIALQSYIIDPDKWNKFAQALSSMEGLLLNFINLSDQGIWSNLTTYKQFQIVTLNGQSFMSKQNTNLNHSPIGGELDTWWTLIAKKGVSLRPLSAWNGITAYVNNQDFIDIVYSNGSAFYCIQSHTNQQPSQAYPPVDTTYWGVLSIRGVQGQDGQQGIPGVGLQFIGTYSPTVTYMKDQAVQYNGSLYACLQDNTTGFLPTNTTYFSLAVAQGASVTFTTLRNTVTLSINVSNIVFVSGGITAFNVNNDSLFVYKNSVYQEVGQDYTIDANGISINITGGGTWDGTVDIPIVFNFVVIKNLIQAITFNDGSLIQTGSVTLDKLVQSVQDSIDSVYPLSLESSGYGIISGLTTTTQSTPDMTVNVATGTVHMANGVRYVPTASPTLAITASDVTNPRIDIVYVNSSGVIAYLAGTPNVSPVVPTTPAGGFLLAEISVAANATIIITANITDKRKIKNTTDTNYDKISVLNGSSALIMTSTQDINSRTTNITYTRSDTSTYKTIDYSNFNSNDKPQTIVTKLYSSSSVLETTNTATVVWSTDGTYVISSSEVMS